MGRIDTLADEKLLLDFVIKLLETGALTGELRKEAIEVVCIVTDDDDFMADEDEPEICKGCGGEMDPTRGDEDDDLCGQCKNP